MVAAETAVTIPVGPADWKDQVNLPTAGNAGQPATGADSPT